MFGRKCELCGGKLDRHNICTECGLDNSKSDAVYIINRSDCDHKPLTHVHEEKPVSPKRVKRTTNPREKSFEKTLNKPMDKWRIPKIIILVIVVLYFGGTIISNLIGLGMSSSFMTYSEPADEIPYEEWEAEEIYDYYADVTREIPAEGDHYVTDLMQGEYVVGVHIPEGIYTCSVVGEFVSFNVEDTVNQIWRYEFLDFEMSDIDDIRLYDGAVISVSEGVLSLETQNAQGEMMREEIPNPLSNEGMILEEFEVAGCAVSGYDFQPGVYNVAAVNGWGSIRLVIYDEDMHTLVEKYIWLDADGDTSNVYLNLVLPMEAELNFEDCEDLTLYIEPSPVISSEDYLDYYKYELVE